MKMVVTSKGMYLQSKNGFVKENVKKFNVEITPRYTSEKTMEVRHGIR